MKCIILQSYDQLLYSPQNQMQIPLFSLSSRLSLKPKTFLSSPFKLRPFCTISQSLSPNTEAIKAPTAKPSCNSKEKIKLIKEKWLSSLSNDGLLINKENIEGNKWVIGVDPDVSGALAVLKSDDSGIISAEVFDSPFVQVSVGKKLRKRLDARSIVELVQSFEAPNGTIAYLEQSVPFPRDGKLGWWSGGFGYGLWIGILVSSGFSVIPVPSVVWKKEFELARSRSSKDDSRELAKQLFPNLSPMLKRKKDHGRAEALLIAAYGKGHKLMSDDSLKSDDSCMTDVAVKLDHTSETVILDGNQSLGHNLNEM